MAHNSDSTRILAAISETYISIHEFDLDRDNMIVLKTNQYIEKWSEGIDSIYEKLQNVMRNITVERHMYMVLRFTDLHTLNERLQKENTISCVFRGKISGWCRAQFIVSERAEDGHVVRVVYCVADINKEKEHEDALLRQANTDALTELNNRGHGEELIRKMFDEGRCGLFCLIDVDKFKQVNDTYGHPIGDQVLTSVAAALKKSTRGKDVLMRYGGDEFIVFLSDVLTDDIAQRVMSRLLNEVRAINIEEMRDHVAISIGARFRTADMSFEKVLELADENLYRSKTTPGSSYNF